MKKRTVEEIIETKRLCTIYRENEAAKFFVSFLRQHPEYTENDINIKITEDGFTTTNPDKRNKLAYAIIYKTREETDEEYNQRMDNIEENIINVFKHCFEKSVNNSIEKTMIHNLSDDRKEHVLNRFTEESVSVINKVFDSSIGITYPITDHKNNVNPYAKVINDFFNA